MSDEADRLDDDEAEKNDSLADLTIGGIKPNRVPAMAQEEPEAVEIGDTTAEVEVQPTEEVDAPMEIPAGVDPLDRKFTYQDMMKEAKRLKDEYAGKLGWISKNVKQKYGGKQKEFEATLAKGEKFDSVQSEIEALKQQIAKLSAAKPEAQPPAGDKAKPKPDVKAIAKQIAEEDNLDPRTIGTIEKILSAKVDINDGQGPLESQEEFERRIAAMEWKRAAVYAESQADYRGNPELARRAQYRSQMLGERPDIALAEARKDLGLVKKPVKQVVGKPVVGKPAVAKDNSAGTPDAIQYDGKVDPLDLLKKKWAK